MSDTNEDIAREIAGDAYGPGVFDEPTNTRAETGSADDDGLSSTVPAGTDVDELRNGGPGPVDGGVVTTTGGTAGPNSFRERPRSGPGVANTTTGDAATGGMDT